jgi:hypothetical protein
MGIYPGHRPVDFVEPDSDFLQTEEEAGSFFEIKVIWRPVIPFFCDIIDKLGHHNWSNNDHSNYRLTFPIRPFFSWMKKTVMFAGSTWTFEKPER